MVKPKANIGIIGLGYVGGALRHWFDKKCKLKKELFVYDKYKKIGSVEEVNKADIIFICVPTPYNKKSGYDDSAVLESLRNLKGGKTVVVKSTVVPGSTARFQKMFPQQRILFNPEFLRARTARADFLKPDRQIIGYTKKSRPFAPRILRLLPKAPFVKIMSATEAEMVKYFGNSFLAMKVVFANQFYDLCVRLGIDYDVVKEAAATDPRIGKSHLEIFHLGYRGYGEGCFPKDVKAIIDFANKHGVNFGLLKKVDEINKKLRVKR